MEFKRLFRFISRFQRHRTVPRTSYCKRDYFRPYTNPNKKSTHAHIFSNKPNWTSVVSVIISICMLLSVIIGFSIFNANTKKLEDMLKYKEFKEYYNIIGLHEELSQLQKKYEFSWHGVRIAFQLKDMGNHNIEENPIEIYPLGGKEHLEAFFKSYKFDEYYRSVWKALFHIRDLYMYVIDMGLMENKFSSIYFDDLNNLQRYLHPIQSYIPYMIEYSHGLENKYSQKYKKEAIVERCYLEIETLSWFQKLYDVSKYNDPPHASEQYDLIDIRSIPIHAQ